MHWDIERQAPDFFNQFSMVTHVAQENRSTLADHNEMHRKGYSLDVSNVDLIK